MKRANSLEHITYSTPYGFCFPVEGTIIVIAQANHLVKRHNVNPAAEADVFGVEAEDALLLEPLLRERIIGCQRGRQYRRHDECQDVETVEQDFVHGSLKAGVGVIGLPIRGNTVMTSRRQNRQALSLKRLEHSFRLFHIVDICFDTPFIKYAGPLLTPFLVHM